jgi:hypothetical protein
MISAGLSLATPQSLDPPHIVNSQPSEGVFRRSNPLTRLRLKKSHVNYRHNEAQYR